MVTALENDAINAILDMCTCRNPLIHRLSCNNCHGRGAEQQREGNATSNRPCVDPHRLGRAADSAVGLTLYTRQPTRQNRTTMHMRTYILQGHSMSGLIVSHGCWLVH
jgi:hypothetical protein